MKKPLEEYRKEASEAAGKGSEISRNLGFAN